ARLGCERLQQEQALARFAGDHEAGDRLEISPGLLLGPESGAGGELLQAESVIAALRVADDAADVTGALLEEEGLDAGLEEFVVERLGGRGRGRQGERRGDEDCDASRQHRSEE